MEAKAATSRRCFAVSGLEVVLLTLFLIALPFPPASLPRRNDANCLLRSLVTVFNIVGCQQQQHAIHRFPSFAIGVLRLQSAPVPQARRDLLRLAAHSRSGPRAVPAWRARWPCSTRSLPRYP